MRKRKIKNSFCALFKGQKDDRWCNIWGVCVCVCAFSWTVSFILVTFSCSESTPSALKHLLLSQRFLCPVSMILHIVGISNEPTIWAESITWIMNYRETIERLVTDYITQYFWRPTPLLPPNTWLSQIHMLFPFYNDPLCPISSTFTITGVESPHDRWPLSKCLWPPPQLASSHRFPRTLQSGCNLMSPPLSMLGF